jgi:non-homologous end joining protein Ku
MPPRPHWKGYLKLSLVSCPIALYPAISAAERVSFRQVNRQTGHRLRQQLVDTVTGEVVEAQNKGRGYEVGDNQFLIVQDEELAAARQEARTRPFSAAPAPPAAAADIKEEPRKREAAPKLVETRQREEEPAAPVLPPRRIENNRTIDLDRCVRAEQVDPRYYLTPYYVAPREDVGEEAFAVIRDAMAATGLVGMGRVVLASRERPIIVQPMGTGLLGMTLRYAHEVRSEVDYFENITNMTLPRDMVQLAEHILETKTEDFDVAYLEDRYRTVLVEKLREKHARMPMKVAASAPSRQNVISLMDALKRSLAVEGPRRSTPKMTSRRTTAARTDTSSKKPPARARRRS